MNYFLDSSALVKRYLPEQGAAKIQGLTDPALQNTLIIAQITRVEVAAALAARHRAPKGISQIVRDQALMALLFHCQWEYQMVPLDDQTLSRAVQLTQEYRLRGYDAVQLATAVVANSALTAVGLPPITFVTADADLITAAHQMGLAAENPQNYP